MKNIKNTWQIIFIMICLCFTMGIIIGAVFYNIGAIQINNLWLKDIIPHMSPFYILFVKNSKMFIAAWFLGFLSFGIPIIMALSIIKGFIYGYAFSYIASINGVEGIKEFILYIVPYNIVSMIPFLISGSFSCCIILKKFVKIKSAKSRLRREKEKNITEFIIIFILSCIMAGLACVLETYLSRYIVVNIC